MGYIEEKNNILNEAEELILGMADLVYENRRLKRDLKEALEYKQKYFDLIYSNIKMAEKSQKSLLKAKEFVKGNYNGCV